MAKDYPAKGSGGPKKLSPKAELARAFEALVKVPFPERSAHNEADLLHAELLLFQSGVFETVATILVGEFVLKEDLRIDRDLKSRIEALAASDDPVASVDAQHYRDYFAQLEALLELAKNATISRKKKR